MVASLAMTAAYHAGYSDFRSDKLRTPVTGDLVWSVPTLATLNPIGLLGKNQEPTGSPSPIPSPMLGQSPKKPLQMGSFA